MAQPLEGLIRSLPDYPKAGIIFRDITTLLQSPSGFRQAVDEMVQPFAGSGIGCVAGIEARGFILGGAVAHQLSVGFVAIRKKGKLPWQTLSVEYELEYGSDEVEIHTDSFEAGQKVLIVDDVLATGGTMAAACQLLEQLEADIVGISVLAELSFLRGRDKLPALRLESAIVY